MIRMDNYPNHTDIRFVVCLNMGLYLLACGMTLRLNTVQDTIRKYGKENFLCYSAYVTPMDI
jgi:hypothetical protein